MFNWLLKYFCAPQMIALWFLLAPAIVHAHKNVLILLGDDVGFESGVYGNKVCKTPNIDRLAKHGVVYDQAFTSVSSCSPSRSAILTGLPQHQNGMYGLQNGYHHFASFDKVRSLPSIVRQHGMFTGIIGKKHVQPDSVYPFDYSRTEMDKCSYCNTLQTGRNITLIKQLVREFLDLANQRPFFLYVAFHDAHRCTHSQFEYGTFCEKFGDSSIPGMGSIPDWKPAYYQPSQIELPYFVPDIEAARDDISKQYTAMSRIDQGVGLILRELTNSKALDDTLVIFTSDNGIPFPNGRTNLYDPGMREPFILSNPRDRSQWGQRSNNLVSLLDIVPTVLDWLELPYPHYCLWHNKKITLTGKSLLSSTQRHNKSECPASSNIIVFGSQSLHEVTMYYPMRAIRTAQYKLIKNLNYRMPFSIDQDFAVSPTFQQMMNFTAAKKDIPWYKTLSQYYNRDMWELYKMDTDPKELHNLHGDSAYSRIADQLKHQLYQWQNETSDPWICAPEGVLEDSGVYTSSPACLPIYNNV